MVRVLLPLSGVDNSKKSKQKMDMQEKETDDSSSGENESDISESEDESGSDDTDSDDTKRQKNPESEKCAEEVRPLFKDDVTCYHEIFDWLSLADIEIVAATCKRLQAIAGDYYRNYLSAKLFKVDKCDKSLSPFIQNVEIRLNYVRWSNYKAIKCIKLKDDCLAIARAKPFQKILNNVESVVLFCNFPSNLYASFLKHCKNLKRLALQNTRDKTIRDNYNDWLTKRYPQLEHIEISSTYFGEITNVHTFLKRNSHIKSLSVDFVFIYYMEDHLLKRDIKLDDLALTFELFDEEDFCEYDNKEEAHKATFDLLHQLYDRGFYKRLHIYDGINGESTRTNHLLNLPGLETICYGRSWGCLTERFLYTDLNRFAHLKELKLYARYSIAALQNLATNLPNLERLYLWNAEFNDIVPFVQHSMKLSKIGIGSRSLDRLFTEKTNLIKLNMEREQLFGSKRIIIYVEEWVYLHLKWQENTVDMKMIELRRKDSYDWPHHFE